MSAPNPAPVPPPGSDAAIKAGCICELSCSRDFPGWLVFVGLSDFFCPLHGDHQLDAAQYVICWRSFITGATGHGTGTFPRWQAEMIRDTLNTNNAGGLTYWIEPVNDPLDDLTMRPRTGAGGAHAE